MEWNAAHIVWDQQVMLVWLLLPPVFILVALMTFAAPIFLRKKK